MKMEENVFAQKVVENINEYLSLEYKDVECEVVRQYKNNGVLQIGISVCNHIKNAVPIIDIKPHYQAAQQGTPIEGIMHNIAGQIQTIVEIKKNPLMNELENYDKIKEFLSVKLINTRANREMLAQMPHKDMEDLSLICALRIPLGDQIGRINVNYDMMKHWNISEEELCQTALENSQKNQEPVLQGMYTTILETMTGVLSTENLLYDQKSPEDLASEKMFVLSNKEKIFGAAVIAYQKSMDEISQLFPQGFYIIPSSVHEVLILPKMNKDEEKYYGNLVREVNQSQVEASEILSDRIYEYDKEQGKLRQVPESIKAEKEVER